MKVILKSSVLAAAAAAISLLASCYGPGPRPPAGPRGYTLDQPPGRYGAQQSPELPGDVQPPDTRYLDPVAPGETPGAMQPPPTLPGAGTPTPPDPLVVAPPDSSKPPANVAPPAPVTPPPQTDFPTAKRTKPGFVKSPFDSLGREIDVRGMRSGQKARCPYTQKVFLVP